MGREPAAPARAADRNGDGEKAHLFELAFEEAPQAIVVAQGGRFVRVNRAAERLTARSRSDLLEKPAETLIHPEDRDEVRRRIEARIAGDEVGDRTLFRVVRADGTMLWVESLATLIHWEGKPAVLAFLDDVSERERVRAEAAELQRFLERVAALTPYFIFVYDYELGRDVYLNRAVPQALGYSDAEAAALGDYPFDRLCHPEDAAAALEREERWRDVEEGVADAVEFRLKARSGDWRWFRSINTPFLRGADGRVRQILGVSLDITQQKRAEEALRRSEKLESLGLLAGGVAHDFGNLLTPIVGHAALLERKLGPETPLESHLAAIRKAAERAGELVQYLLVVSGRGEFEPQPVDLGGLIVEAAAMLEPILSEEVALRSEIAPSLPLVAGDPTQLRQVIHNLVGNAADALAGSGGSIVVRALPVELDAGQAAVLELREQVVLGPAVLLEVEDDGPGMDESTRARLLEPFFTTKPKGRGLGLASVVGIVRRHRGGLEVDSKPGRGTVFRILLPLAEQTARTAASTG